MDKDLDGFKNFLLEKELSQGTIQNYLHAVRKYFKSYPELTKSNILAWKSELVQTLAACTVNARLIAIKCYASYKGVFVPVKAVKIQRVFSTSNIITDEQYTRLMDGLKADGDTQWYYNMLILAKTGTRISEAVRLKKSDIMRGYATIVSKGKVRTILFPCSLKVELNNYLRKLDNQEYLLQSSKCRGNRPISRRACCYALTRFSERYGIPQEVMHPHSFRHHFAIKVMDKTKDITLLADLLGHSNVSTTMIYTRLSSNQQQKALDDAIDW
ncbi:MAG: site-specific integrase [Oscillospiraceae bacterium]|nr:site-specific integrase [Oscillospiraceae bacterium]